MPDLEQQVRTRLNGGRLLIEMGTPGWEVTWRRVYGCGVESDERNVRWCPSIEACLVAVLTWEDAADLQDGSTADSCGVCL